MKKFYDQLSGRTLCSRPDPQVISNVFEEEYFSYLIDTFKNIRETKSYFSKVDPYQILVSKPWGNQLYTSLDTKDNFNLTRKRSLVNSKFGFGELDEYGYEYAMFDDTLYLNPI